jgi:large subunit ribosomal protein L9
MKIIFLHDVPRVGKKHDIKDISDGYATNFLFPRKLAEMATPSAIANLEQRKKELVVQKEIQEDLLMKNLEEIKSKIVTIKEKADEKGHLFASVHKKEIIEAMKAEHQAEISEEFIILEKPIKAVGEFEIPIQVKNKKSSFKLVVERL